MSSAKTNRDILEVILSEIKTLSMDINVVKKDIQYVKTLITCKKKVEDDLKIVEPKEEEVYQGWWWRS